MAGECVREASELCAEPWHKGGGAARARARVRQRAGPATLAQQGRARLAHLTKFLLRMRGALTDAATMVLPVRKMPQEAPMMHRVRDRAVPREAKKKGLTLLNTEDQSVLAALR